MTRYLRERPFLGPQIEEDPHPDLGLVVVIPSKDEPQLLDSLTALQACAQTSCAVEVIVVVNTSEVDSPERVQANRDQAAEAKGWALGASRAERAFHILECHGLPKKQAGVGLARKIGMDEACRRLEGVGKPSGVIACFDADSGCDPNYLIELQGLFQREETCQACSIYFEHPLEGDAHAKEVYDAITQYELHLRYYVNAQRWAGFPWAIQTIGSSMAVRCDAYQDQNGMNQRQAGEDFYFLHKFTPLEHVHFLNTTRVIPSPRPSHRVPFGTGKAVGDLLEKEEALDTYAPKSFEDLRSYFGKLDLSFTESMSQDLPEPLRAFLQAQNADERITEIRANVTSLGAFRVRFFRWFNAFRIMKYLHYCRDLAYPNVPVEEAAHWLLEVSGQGSAGAGSKELLQHYRQWDLMAPHAG